MNIKPLGHRILVQPDEQQSETASGLVLLETRHHVPVSGTVVALGNGLPREQRVRQRAVSRCISLVDDLAGQFPNSNEYANALRDEFGRIKAQAEILEPSLCVGDHVAFPANVGMTVTIDGVPYITLNEEDVVVTIAESVAA